MLMYNTASFQKRISEAMSIFWFVLVSFFEGIAIFTATLSLYRFRVQKYLWQISIISLLQAFISYFLREEQDLSTYVPVISIALIIFLVYAFVVNSFFWCVVMAVTGFIYHVVIQTVLLYLMESIDLISLERVQQNTIDTYLLLGTSSMITILTSLLLYNKGLGLSFDFDRFRLKGENGIITAIISLTLIALIYIALVKTLTAAAISFVFCLIFLLYFLIKKEMK